jgi:hypothetical protein
MGLIDEAAGEASVLPASVEIARQLAALPAQALRQTRGQIRSPVIEQMSRQGGADEAVGGIWRSDAAQQAIGGYVERVLRRG